MKYSFALLVSILFILACQQSGQNADENGNAALEEVQKQPDPVHHSDGSMSGIYKNVAEQELGYYSQVIINELGRGKFSFQIAVRDQEDCVGELYGIADIKNRSTAVFSDENCDQVKFSFSERTVIIASKNCEAINMKCAFDGTYAK